jgi:hypothetical protein
VRGEPVWRHSSTVTCMHVSGFTRREAYRVLKVSNDMRPLGATPLSRRIAVASSCGEYAAA